MDHRTFARTNSQSSGSSHGGSAVFHIDLLILAALSLSFAIVSAYTASKLHAAFLAAYQDTAIESANAVEPPPASGDVQPSLHSDYFRAEVVRWETAILEWSQETGLPADLIAVVMQIESCGDQHALSPAGAAGIFQVMPFHFGTGEDPFDPEINAKRGLAYLAKGYELSGGRIDRTLAGYNGGHSQIGRSPEHWPEETRRYVQWGVGIWDDIHGARNPSPTLERWLQAGGARLCASSSATALRLDAVD